MRNHDRRAQHSWHRGGNGWNNPTALDASWSTAPGPALLGVPSTGENHHANTGATVRN